MTRHFPHLVAADGRAVAAHLPRMARSHFDDSVGVIAAWAADEDLLGKHAAVDRYLNAQAARRHLNASRR